MKTIFFDNDYRLIDGDKIVRGHKTEATLGEFAVGQLEKTKYLSMHIGLAEEEADTLLDCIIDEHFTSGGDIKGLDDALENIGNFLDYFLDRLPKSVKITDEDTVPDEDTAPNLEESVPNFEESIPNLEPMAEAESQPF